jgi:hypothetical protein
MTRTHISMTLSRIATAVMMTAALASAAGAQAAETPLSSTTGQRVPHTFKRYTVPNECDESKTWTEQQFWRDKRPDTTYFPRTGHRNQGRTADSVKSCLAKFSLGTTAQRQLIGLGQAYLTANQDADAETAFAKLMSTVANEPAQPRGWAMYQIVESYLNTDEPRLVKAEEYIKQLDALGAGAAVERMLAHKSLADAARFRDSIPLWERELNAAMVAMKEITGDTRKEYAPASAQVYAGLADLKARLDDAPGALAIVATGRAELVPLRPSVARMFEGLKRLYSLHGKPAVPIKATKWVNTGAAGDARPVSGKPTLLYFTSASCADLCYVSHAVARRLAAKYGARGLDITYVTRTGGYFRNKLVKPDSEMVKIADYYQSVIKAPAAVAIWQTVLGKRDDGRVTVESAPNESAYEGAGTLLIDGKGVIRLTLTMSRGNEAILEDVIESLLTP